MAYIPLSVTPYPQPRLVYLVWTTQKVTNLHIGRLFEFLQDNTLINTFCTYPIVFFYTKHKCEY